jgi:hypothetical protein
MSGSVVFEPGGYRYAPGVFQYSAGVAAESGFEIVHVRFAEVLPLTDGFERIRAHLKAEGRPLQAFCQCELRSPAPFTEQGFRTFNEIYVGTLEAWGIYRAGINPVARSNVCPKIAPPAEPSFYAFSYTRPAGSGTVPTCVVAGSGEAPEGKANYKDHIVALGDTSLEGMRLKAGFVTAEMKRRLATLDMDARTITTAQVYTVEPMHALLESELIPSDLAAHGLLWHYCRPPVVGLDFEMDCRIVATEYVI